jgi:putative endonuclease
MRENNRAKGSRYEERAAAYLTDQGMTILERNYRCRLGEIDIIARDGYTLCFVEVKYRSGSRKGYPLEAVGPAKQRKIYQTASVYLKQQGLSMDTSCRFDVVSVMGEEISHIPGAFGGM